MTEQIVRDAMHEIVDVVAGAHGVWETDAHDAGVGETRIEGIRHLLCR